MEISQAKFVLLRPSPSVRLSTTRLVVSSTSSTRRCFVSAVTATNGSEDYDECWAFPVQGAGARHLVSLWPSQVLGVATFNCHLVTWPNPYHTTIFVCGHSVVISSHSHFVTQSSCHTVIVITHTLHITQTVISSQSHLVTQSSCHKVILSHSHLVTQSYCHTVLLSHSHLVTQSSCHTVILSHSHLITQTSCQIVISSYSHLITQSSCHTVILSQLVTQSYCHICPD